jgi:hypothetical protein
MARDTDESDDTVVEYDDPHEETVQESARRRQRERTDRIETMLDERVELMDEEKYPTTSEELAVEYADEPIDLPNETESLGSVFDRLVDERFDSPEALRAAVLNEVTAETNAEEADDRTTGGATDR